MHPEDEVVPLAAVVQPAPHAAHSGVGMEALPPADHCPTGHTLQLGPPLPAAQTPDEQAASEVAPVALVVEPEGHAVQAALGTEGVPPAEYAPRRHGAQAASPVPAWQMVTGNRMRRTM